MVHIILSNPFQRLQWTVSQVFWLSTCDIKIKILIILTFEQKESKKYEHQKLQIISFLKIFLKSEC